MSARAVSFLLFSLAAALTAPAAEPDGNPVEGGRLYLAYGCYECHGTTGAGGGAAGPRLAPNPLPQAAIQAKVRTSSGRMPVYAPSVITDSQIAAIAAYLRASPRGKPAKDIPLLN